MQPVRATASSERTRDRSRPPLPGSCRQPAPYGLRRSHAPAVQPLGFSWHLLGWPITMVALNLGCGLDYCPGTVNVDRYTPVVADLQADALRLPLAKGSVTRIEARQLVEHLGYAGTIYALAEWWRVLESGGSILIETPDRPAAFLAAAEPDPAAPTLHWVYGLPWPGYEHRTLFDKGELRNLVERSGFDQVEVTQPDTLQPTLRLTAHKCDNLAAELRARLHTGFVAAGIVEPDTAPPYLEHLETICSQVVAAAEAVPQDGPAACLATVLGATARYDPRVTQVAVQVLAAREIVPEGAAKPYLDIACSLAREAYPARMAAYLRLSSSPPGIQAHRLRWLADQVSLYLTARLHPSEKSLHPTREAFKATTTAIIPADREILFFCAETVAGLSRRETARGVRAFARKDWATARQHFENAVAYDADNPLPVWNLARLAMTGGRNLDAIKRYAALLELLPEAADALHAEMDAATGREPGSRHGDPGHGLGGPVCEAHTGPVGRER